MGPLHGLRVVEFAGLGPAPFAAMMLGDMGAEVIRIDRANAVRPDKASPSGDLLARGRKSIGIDLKHPLGMEVALRLISRADVLLEGFRPGVMERFGLGPEVCFEKNSKLVYARMTGWGQEGPLAQAAGHDINYIALSGVLHYLGRQGQPPTPPVNLVADFGGGGMLMAFGILCALWEVHRSGRGQVIDAAMVDGSSLLMTMVHGFLRHGLWPGGRGENLLDTGAPFYEVYETSDGKYVSIGSIEPQFYKELLEKAGLSAEDLGAQLDRDRWPAAKEKLAQVFRTRTQAQWCAIMEGSDVCFAPVLDMDAAIAHPHAKARKAFVNVAGIEQPAPAPRFSRSAASTPTPPPRPGRDTREVLQELGYLDADTQALCAAGAVA